MLDDPEKKRTIGDNKKQIHTMISFLFSLIIKIAGQAKKDIHKILKPYVPIKDIICNISRFSEKLNAIKFQGKPVKILPLRNSIKPIKSENKNKLLTGFFIFIKKKQ
tara:strand:+ start:181 stop:501 length:321 start_codon:yes stop_codon:yes gene_type:complete